MVKQKDIKDRQQEAAAKVTKAAVAAAVVLANDAAVAAAKVSAEEASLHRQAHTDIGRFLDETKGVDWKAVAKISQDYNNRQVLEKFADRAFIGLKAVIVFLALVGGLYLTVRAIIDK